MKILLKQFQNFFIILFFVAFAFTLIYGHNINADEGVALNGAWNIYNGKTLYKDFFEYVGPLSFYLVYFTFLFFGPNYFSALIPSIFLLLISSYFIFKISYKIFHNRRDSLISAYLWLLLSSISYPLINHNTYSSIMSIVFTYYFIKYLEREKEKNMLISGALCSLIFFFLQTKGVAIFLAMLVFFAYLMYKKNISLKDTLYFMLGYALVFLLGFMLWGKNLFLPLFQIGQGYSNIHTLGAGFFSIIILLFVFNTFLMRKKINNKILLLIFIQIALLFSILNQFNPTHLVINIFPYIILSILTIKMLLEKYYGENQEILKKIIFLIVIIISGYLTYLKNVENRRDHKIYTQEVEILKRIVGGEKIFSFPFISNFYLELKKPNPYYNSVLLENLNSDEHFKKNLAILKQENPKFILAQYNVVEQYRFTKNNMIDSYMREAYKKEYSLGALEIWVRK